MRYLIYTLLVMVFAGLLWIVIDGEFAIDDVSQEAQPLENATIDDIAKRQEPLGSKHHLEPAHLASPENDIELDYDHHEHYDGHEISEKAIEKSHWFMPAVMQSESRFRHTETQLDLAESCKKHPAISKQSTLEQFIKNEYHVDTSERHPQDVFFKTITQFIQHGNQSIQLTMTWDRDLPATYRYELFSSFDARLEEGVEQIESPVSVPKVKDVLSSYDYMQRIIAFYQSQGAVIGAQILESEINGTSQPVSITTVNGQPTFISSELATCESEYSTTTAYCQCKGA